MCVGINSACNMRPVRIDMRNAHTRKLFTVEMRKNTRTHTRTSSMRHGKHMCGQIYARLASYHPPPSRKLNAPRCDTYMHALDNAFAINLNNTRKVFLAGLAYNLGVVSQRTAQRGGHAVLVATRRLPSVAGDA